MARYGARCGWKAFSGSCNVYALRNIRPQHTLERTSYHRYSAGGPDWLQMLQKYLSINGSSDLACTGVNFNVEKPCPFGRELLQHCQSVHAASRSDTSAVDTMDPPRDTGILYSKTRARPSPLFLGTIASCPLKDSVVSPCSKGVVRVV